MHFIVDLSIVVKRSGGAPEKHPTNAALRAKSEAELRRIIQSQIEPEWRYPRRPIHMAPMGRGDV